MSDLYCLKIDKGDGTDAQSLLPARSLMEALHTFNVEVDRLRDGSGLYVSFVDGKYVFVRGTIETRTLPSGTVIDGVDCSGVQIRVKTGESVVWRLWLESVQS